MTMFPRLEPDSVVGRAVVQSSKAFGSLSFRRRKMKWFVAGNLAVANEQAGIVKVTGSAWYITRSLSAYVKVAPTGASILIDIQKKAPADAAFSSILATGLTILATAQDDDGTARVTTKTVLPVGTKIRLDITQVGSGVVGQDLTVELDFDGRVAAQ